MTDKPFSIDVPKLKATSKPAPINPASLKSVEKSVDPTTMARVDQVAEDNGFVQRQPAARPGRRPSPRTGQIHAKVYPAISTEIAELAARRGTTQGVILEEAWAAYKKQNPDL